MQNLTRTQRGAGPQARLVISAAHKLPISPQMGSGGTRVKQ
jgi:hypothetical protein